MGGVADATQMRARRPAAARTSPRPGTAAFTADRLARWELGERADLWEDLTEPQRRKTGNSKETRLRRAGTLTREGLDRKAVAALVSEPLVEPCAGTRRQLEALHPGLPRRPGSWHPAISTPA